MPTLTSISLLLVTTIVICIIPGPDMLYIIARSTGQGRSSGIVSCLGIATGGVLQTTAVALGLSGLFLAVPVAYEVIKFAGALYLIYLGVRTLLSREEMLAGTGSERTGLLRAFFQGALTTLLNPKVAFFYLAFLPQFVDPARGAVPLQLLLLGLLFNLVSLSIDSSISLLASALGIWLKRHVGAAKIIQKLTGGILVGLGVRLAFSSRQ
ncbi:LysE family translocator [Dictyobacter aurantiacus]|nr:LysE family translocator [Dictyobacter aurantiacus]